MGAKDGMRSSREDRQEKGGEDVMREQDVHPAERTEERKKKDGWRARRQQRRDSDEYATR